MTGLQAAGFLLSIVAYVPYAAKVACRQARPARASWIVFGTLDLVLLLGMMAQGVFAWQILAYVVGIATTLSLAFIYGGERGWTRLDKWCLGAAGGAIVLWRLTSAPDVAIVISLGVLCIGSIPMWVYAWRDPYREPLFAWSISWAGGVCGVLAVPSWTFGSAASPVTFLILQTTTIGLLLARRRRPAMAIATQLRQREADRDPADSMNCPHLRDRIPS